MNLIRSPIRYGLLSVLEFSIERFGLIGPMQILSRVTPSTYMVILFSYLVLSIADESCHLAEIWMTSNAFEYQR